ncbi:hypothetical protein NBT05_12245 [Aquimarina sp. ERC-38]|uniref:hypothetical protein n=1 Tax=Aquimarina sp. ERC-38 TaxID=2949996 RepID=UPI00224647B8|nr:hypothetical protein [Aquimarina sp. ERC-38]UZO79720.1 hypothetical protein NBT05_12245 [Aquimarina sp. ERC-38]
MNSPKFLYHYYETENGPFRNITELGLDKAKNIQNQISKGWNSKRPDNYIELRFALEKRIKELFIEKGGKPHRKDPFYFTLGPCSWAKSWYVNPGVVKIPLNEFTSDQISFTFPDSMVSFQFYDEPKLKTYRKECNGQIFRIEELEKLIREYGLPSDDQLIVEESNKYDKYIEAQVWDDTVINRYKNVKT